MVVEVSRWFKHGDHPAVVEDQSPYVRPGYGWIETLEGGHVVAPGDWIVSGPHGECYPVKDEVFRADYEPVDDNGEGAALALAAYNRFLATRG